MDEFKINRWVDELICRAGFLRRLEFLPQTFYRQLSEGEQREVIKRYRERQRSNQPFRETK